MEGKSKYKIADTLYFCYNSKIVSAVPICIVIMQENVDGKVFHPDVRYEFKIDNEMIVVMECAVFLNKQQVADYLLKQ